MEVDRTDVQIEHVMCLLLGLFTKAYVPQDFSTNQMHHIQATMLCSQTVTASKNQVIGMRAFSSIVQGQEDITLIPNYIWGTLSDWRIKNHGSNRQ